jgi:hypothetical protein
VDISESIPSDDSIADDDESESDENQDIVGLVAKPQGGSCDNEQENIIRYSHPLTGSESDKCK